MLYLFRKTFDVCFDYGKLNVFCHTRD